MSPEHLRDIEECAAGAVPGPLKSGGEDGDYPITDVTGREVGWGYDRGTSVFFARARSWVPELVLAVRDVTERLDAATTLERDRVLGLLQATQERAAGLFDRRTGPHVRKLLADLARDIESDDENVNRCARDNLRLYQECRAELAHANAQIARLHHELAAARASKPDAETSG